MRAIRFLLVLLPALAVAQEVDPDLLFHVSFDRHSAEADVAGGEAASTTFTESLDLRGAEGVVGRGFVLANGEERLNYAMPGNLRPQAGTVSLWLQPVNWDGSNQRFELFFAARGTGWHASLYKYHMPSNLLWLFQIGDERWIARTDMSDWKAGEWHKLDATWDATAIRLFVDGELASETLLPDGVAMPTDDRGTLMVTPPKLWEQYFDVDDRTLVDEVRVYGRPRGTVEIRADYLRERGLPADGPPLDAMLEIDSAAERLTVQLSTLPDPARERTAEARIVADGATLAAATAPVDARGSATLELPTDALAPGEYQVEVIVRGGAEDLTLTRPLVRPDPWWREVRPVDEHAVPQPWTPVTGEGGRVEVWNRSHTFDGPLPAAIVAGGEPLLAEPARMRLNGAALEWSPIDWTEQSADRWVGESRATSADVSLRAVTTVEFDGMIRCDLSLEPSAAGAAVDNLALTLAVPDDAAQLVLAPVRVPWDGERVELGFEPLVWLAGHERGLCWFAESPANWVTGEAQPIVAERADGRVRLTVQPIGRRAELPGPVSYTFGLQATPMRPLPARWRRFNMSGGGTVPGQHSQTIGWGGGAMKQFGYLEPRTPELFDQFLKRLDDKGIVQLQYSTPTHMPNNNPIHDWYKLAWRHTSGSKFTGYKDADGQPYDQVATCPNSEYGRLMVAWVDRLTRDHPMLGGIYYDICGPSPCSNTRHGCGGVDAFGQRYATHPIFALRDTLKQVITILHERDRVLFNHNHSRFYPPCHAFSDYWWPGEQYTGYLGTDRWYYTDQIPLDEWQVELSAHNRGVGVTFLPEYGRGTPKEDTEGPQPSRSLLAAALLHDVPVSASWINTDEVAQIWAAFERLGETTAAFLPYWRPGPVSAAAPLRASAWQGENGTLVIVSNLSPDPANGPVALPAGAVTDAVTDEPANASALQVPGRDFRLLWVVPEG